MFFHLGGWGRGQIIRGHLIGYLIRIDLFLRNRNRVAIGVVSSLFRVVMATLCHPLDPHPSSSQSSASGCSKASVAVPCGRNLSPGNEHTMLILYRETELVLYNTDTHCDSVAKLSGTQSSVLYLASRYTSSYQP